METDQSTSTEGYGWLKRGKSVYDGGRKTPESPLLSKSRFVDVDLLSRRVDAGPSNSARMRGGIASRHRKGDMDIDIPIEKDSVSDGLDRGFQIELDGGRKDDERILRWPESPRGVGNTTCKLYNTICRDFSKESSSK